MLVGCGVQWYMKLKKWQTNYVIHVNYNFKKKLSTGNKNNLLLLKLKLQL